MHDCEQLCMEHGFVRMRQQMNEPIHILHNAADLHFLPSFSEHGLRNVARFSKIVRFRLHQLRRIEERVIEVEDDERLLLPMAKITVFPFIASPLSRMS